jgi:APA family basic amino acid/polyamine antiporter
MSAFLTAMLAALWAYDGWIYPANISGEIINPRRNLPLALIFGISITIVLYIAVNYVFMYVLSLDEIRSIGENEIGALPVAEIIFGIYGKLILQILILVCSFGALNGNIISLPRKYYRMAHEGYFFRNARNVHPRFRTPVVALIYSMVWSCILLFSGSFDMLTDMVIFTAFVFYGLLAVALIKLKRNGTIKEKVAGYPWVPVLFLLFSIALTVHTFWTEPEKSFIGLLLILSSVPFYFFFKSVRR